MTAETIVLLKLKHMKDFKELTDEQVVDYVRTEDKESYREIVARFQDKLLRYANYLTGDEMESADIVQSSLIKAFVNLNSFDTKKKFSSWIYRIVHNEAVNSLVLRKNETLMPEDADFFSREDIAAELSKEELREMVKSCFSQMSLLYSEPLSLFFLEEKSYEEISDILRLPVSTVGTRINRAKILMKKICQTTKK